MDGLNVACLEMKASKTVKSEYLKALHYLDATEGYNYKHYLINTSDSSQKRTNEEIVSWNNLIDLFSEI